MGACSQFFANMQEGHHLMASALVAGVVQIHQAGEALFQSVGIKVRDASAKASAINLGLKCFPDGLDGLQPLVGAQSTA